MTANEYDLIIIGSGNAGWTTATAAVNISVIVGEMKTRGGGGPEGTQISPGQNSSYPIACDQVRVVNQAGGILECLTFQDACARGVVTDAALCTVPINNLAAVSNSAPLARTAAESPVSVNSCLPCGGIVILLLLMDFLLGTNLIIRRGQR